MLRLNTTLLEYCTMQAIEVTAQIDEQGEIHITLPKATPAGTARVLVLLDDPIAEAKTPALQDVDAFFAELEKFAITPRPKAEIDEQLANEREDWD